MFEDVIDFIQETYKTKSFIPLHEPRFVGNEKKYLNEINRIHAHKKRIYGWAQTDKRAVGNNISHR